MGFIDKIKNIFIEEYEDYEEEDTSPKEEKLARKVEIPKTPLRENKEIVHEEINLNVNNNKVEIHDDEEEEEDTEIYVSPRVKLDEPIEEQETADVEIKITPEEFQNEPEIEDDGEVYINNNFTNDYSDQDLIPETENRVLYPEKKELSYVERVKSSNNYSSNYSNNYNGNYNSNYNSNYNRPYQDTKEVKKFKPSPVISPVYGVLDTNYKKEDIKEKKEPRFVNSFNKKEDIDTVRKRAFGEEEKVSYKVNSSIDATKEVQTPQATKVEVKQTIVKTVEIPKDNKSREEYRRNVEEPKKERFDVNNSKPQVSKVTLQDADEYYHDLGLAYNVDYKDVSTQEVKREKVNYNNNINRTYENKNNQNNEKMHRYHDEKKKDGAVNDNLFDLIDSMYNKED